MKGLTRHAQQVAKRYAKWIGPLREAARANGYALAVHGSLKRDIDLIAVPWVDGAAEPELMVEAMRAAIGGYLPENANTPKQVHCKPHGRLTWTMLPPDGVAFFDISVVPMGTPGTPKEGL